MNNKTKKLDKKTKTESNITHSRAALFTYDILRRAYVSS